MRKRKEKERGGEKRRGRRKRQKRGGRKRRRYRKASPHLKVFKSELHLPWQAAAPEQQATPPRQEAGQQGIVWQRRNEEADDALESSSKALHSAHLEKVGWNAIKDLRGTKELPRAEEVW